MLAVALAMPAVAQVPEAAPAGVAIPGPDVSGDDTPPPGGFTLPISLRGFHISGSVKTLYDDNIIRLGKGESADDDRSKSDFRFTPQVSATYAQPFGRQLITVGAELGRDLYARNDQLNKTRYAFNGNLLWRVGRSCSGIVSADFRRRQSLVTDASIRRDNTQRLQSYQASADCAPPVGIGFGGSVSYNETENESITRSLQDSRSTSYDAHLNFGARNLGTFSAGGVLTRISYPKRTLFIDDGAGNPTEIGDKLDIYSGRIGYSRTLGQRININASASYVKVKPDPRDVLSLAELFPGGPLVFFPNARQSFSGPAYTLGLGYTPTPRLAASAFVSRNITSSNNVGARFTVRDNANMQVTYRIGPSISTSAGGSINRQNYKGSLQTIDEPLPRNKDQISRVFARVGYSPRALLGIEFELAHQRRKSDPSIYSFSSTSATLTLRTSFGR